MNDEAHNDLKKYFDNLHRIVDDFQKETDIKLRIKYP